MHETAVARPDRCRRGNRHQLVQPRIHPEVIAFFSACQPCSTSDRRLNARPKFARHPCVARSLSYDIQATRWVGVRRSSLQDPVVGSRPGQTARA